MTRPDDGPDRAVLYALVDGELTEAEQREVLLRLDAEPGGWRELALLFVEAQRWSRELRTVAAHAAGGAAVSSPRSESGPACEIAIPDPAAPQASPPQNAVPIHLTLRRNLRQLSAAAALLAVGVLLGVVLGRVGDGGTARQEMAGGTEADPKVNAPSPAGLSRGPLPADRSSADRKGSQSADDQQAAYRIIRLGLAEPGSGDLELVEAAVQASSGMPVLWLQSPVEELPEAVRRRMERTAYEVVASQKVYPVRLETGEPIVLVGQDQVQVQVREAPRPVY